jgi:hypothetical protein
MYEAIAFVIASAGFAVEIDTADTCGRPAITIMMLPKV